ncbi:MAG: hypothetical protein M5R36_19705 [Deltaproteobacteria bacterium]|nr:hypothetical protein [Deltaproteobacteria bacterium]
MSRRRAEAALWRAAKAGTPALPGPAAYSLGESALIQVPSLTPPRLLSFTYLPPTTYHLPRTPLLSAF